ncbi:hypothetical protein XarbCFBP7610_02390 [Xanthomonas arboricola]|nr:hypothetical protein XarbCFBP7610_02390 [Xanthomonas arboricola]
MTCPAFEAPAQNAGHGLPLFIRLHMGGNCPSINFAHGHIHLSLDAAEPACPHRSKSSNERCANSLVSLCEAQVPTSAGTRAAYLTASASAASALMKLKKYQQRKKLS